MAGEKDNSSKPDGAASGSDNRQWLWLGLGAFMAIIGGAIKVGDILSSPGVFDYVFFRGAAYVFTVAGISLLIFTLGYHILLGADGDGDR